MQESGCSVEFIQEPDPEFKIIIFKIDVVISEVNMDQQHKEYDCCT
jgi:hypothetical protein